LTAAATSDVPKVSRYAARVRSVQTAAQNWSKVRVDAFETQARMGRRTSTVR
jgi:hypothetical protein